MVDVELALHQSLRLADGSTLTFTGYTVEDIAESPHDPVSYPAGSGVTLVFTVEREGVTHQLAFSELPGAYGSKLHAVWPSGEAHFVALEGALTAHAAARLRVTCG